MRVVLGDMIIGLRKIIREKQPELSEIILIDLSNQQAFNLVTGQ